MAVNEVTPQHMIIILIAFVCSGFELDCQFEWPLCGWSGWRVDLWTVQEQERGRWKNLMFHLKHIEYFFDFPDSKSPVCLELPSTRISVLVHPHPAVGALDGYFPGHYNPIPFNSQFQLLFQKWTGDYPITRDVPITEPSSVCSPIIIAGMSRAAAGKKCTDSQ